MSETTKLSDRYPANVIELSGGEVSHAKSIVQRSMRPQCSKFAACSVHATKSGPSGKAELLCLIEADVIRQGFWYGYVRAHPEKSVFSSCIVYVTAFVDADNDELLFKRFDYWTRVRLKYEPCRADGFEDVYSESKTFVQAARVLAEMIENRNPVNNGYLPPEFRITEIFGMENHKNADGIYPQMP